jgi:hypothetical protein
LLLIYQIINMLSLYTEYSGEDFNLLCKDKIFYKFLNDNLIHYNFKYELGLNIDVLPFNPTKKCSSGGLYFCEESKIPLYCTMYGTKLAIVEIPDNARIYIEEDKFKTNKIFITKIIDFNSIDEEFWINIIPNNGLVLQYVKNQTAEICKLAVQQNGTALRYVKKQTASSLLEICKLAVQQDGMALKYVKEQTPEICKLAVQQNPFAIQDVKQQYHTEELYTLAVQRYGRTLRYT